jgi:hypothetical protein
MDKKFYINLSNGIQFLPKVTDENIGFIRIQSTLLEQKRWEQVLIDLDYDFLLSLAIGRECVVVDYSARKLIPRSIYQGIEFIKYILYREWFNTEYQAKVKGFNTTKYFNQVHKTLHRTKPMKKIQYFKKFLLTDKLNISTIYGKSNYDSDYDNLRCILAAYTGPADTAYDERFTGIGQVYSGQDIGFNVSRKSKASQQG